MKTDAQRSTTRLYFLLKLFGGMFLYWMVVWGLHFLYYGDSLLPSNYVWISVLIPAAAALELAARDKSRKSLSGLSRAAIWGISQREILFVLVTMLGVLVMSKDETHSRTFLGLFLFLYSIWISWMNHVGRRMLHRRIHRLTKAREAHHGAMTTRHTEN